MELRSTNHHLMTQNKNNHHVVRNSEDMLLGFAPSLQHLFGGQVTLPNTAIMYWASEKSHLIFSFETTLSRAHHHHRETPVPKIAIGYHAILVLCMPHNARCNAHRQTQTSSVMTQNRVTASLNVKAQSKVIFFP